MKKLILSLLVGILLVSCAMAEIYKGSTTSTFILENNSFISGNPAQVSSIMVSQNHDFNLLFIAAVILILGIILYFLFKKKKKLSKKKNKIVSSKKKL